MSAASGIAARIAALREAGYRGPVDALGFADSGDRAADMARNYWAGREARQKEEDVSIRQTISRVRERVQVLGDRTAGTPWGREAQRAGYPERELGDAAERYLSGEPARTEREAALFAEFDGREAQAAPRPAPPENLTADVPYPQQEDHDPVHDPECILGGCGHTPDGYDDDPGEEPERDSDDLAVWSAAEAGADQWAGRTPEEITADYWGGRGPEYEAAAAASAAVEDAEAGR